MERDKKPFRDWHLQLEARELHVLAAELDRLWKMHSRDKKIRLKAQRAFEAIWKIGQTGFTRWVKRSHSDL